MAVSQRSADLGIPESQHERLLVLGPIRRGSRPGSRGRSHSGSHFSGAGKRVMPPGRPDSEPAPLSSLAGDADTRDRGVRHERQAFARAVVDHGEDAEAAAIGRQPGGRPERRTVQRGFVRLPGMPRILAMQFPSALPLVWRIDRRCVLTVPFGRLQHLSLRATMPRQARSKVSEWRQCSQLAI